MDITTFQLIFAKVMYTLIFLVVSGVFIKMVYDRIKYGKWFEDDVDTELDEEGSK